MLVFYSMKNSKKSPIKFLLYLFISLKWVAIKLIKKRNIPLLLVQKNVSILKEKILILTVQGCRYVHVSMIFIREYI